MRQIGTIVEERQARRLADVLLTCGIRSQVEKADGQWAVWVYDEDRVQEGRERLAEFVRNPDDPRFAQAEQTADRLREDQVQKRRQVQKQTINVRSRWDRGQAPSGRPLTWFLIVASVAVALGTDFGQSRSKEALVHKLLIDSHNSPNHGVERLLSSRSDVGKGEVWRLVTPIFLHLSPMHLLFNVFATYSLSGLLEMRLGTLRLLMMVLGIAVVSNVAQYAYAGPGFGGLSGVIYGLFGFVWIKSKFDFGFGIRLDPRSVVIMFGFLFLCLTGAMGSIANTAHFVGLTVGIMWAFATLPR